MKQIRIKLSPEAEEVYRHLNAQAPESKLERMILNAVNQKIELIKANPHYGVGIQKKLIPKEYMVKYGVTNLFRVELPNFWRMLYTLTAEEEIEIIAFVLDIVDHKTYNKNSATKRNRR